MMRKPFGLATTTAVFVDGVPILYSEETWDTSDRLRDLGRAFEIRAGWRCPRLDCRRRFDADSPDRGSGEEVVERLRVVATQHAETHA